jgi:hypothetical protein
VQHVDSVPRTFPWRTATLVVGALAAIELVALLGMGAVRLAPARSHTATTAAGAAATTKPRAHHAAPHVRKVAPPPAHPLRARSSVRVLVLNGNGVQGAASSTASRLQASGYRIGGAENAARHNYARSMVMFVPGWVKEARRLAQETGIRMVAPVDGLRPRTLKGSKLVVLLGS